VQRRQLAHFAKTDPDYGQRVADKLARHEPALVGAPS